VEETWNREVLHAEVWEQPLVKVAAKYGISAVALGKVCRKLQIPLPGRGYWTKKEFGKPVEKSPLPEADNLPVVRRLKNAFANTMDREEDKAAEVENDPELIRIAAMKNTVIPVNANAKFHKFVEQTRRALKEVGEDSRGILIRPRVETTLDIRVSKKMVDRALRLMNAFVLKIESEGFTLQVESKENGKQRIYAQVFNQTVHFSIVEKAFQKNKREVKEYSWTRVVYDYEPCGMLEFHVGDDSYYRGFRSFRDGKTRTLESLLGECFAELMLDARRQRIEAEVRRREALEERKKEEELEQLAKLIKEEEKKVQELNLWVEGWTKARRMRKFIVALEKEWIRQGVDLSPEAPKGKRIVWMKEQADRLDPMVPSPPSILDRKRELSFHFA
jgi:hypothetical protein